MLIVINSCISGKESFLDELEERITKIISQSTPANVEEADQRMEALQQNLVQRMTKKKA